MTAYRLAGGRQRVAGALKPGDVVDFEGFRYKVNATEPAGDHYVVVALEDVDDSSRYGRLTFLVDRPFLLCEVAE